ncbi:MAG: sensor histidine kinase [Vicinamibacteria bacterium]|nr:sensor histidine kinase [Vicinamibacteria bacterium]
MATPGQIELRLDLASVGLNLDQAIPCGLIVNELLSNSLKHGFPAGRSGEIHIELHRIGDEGLRLRVSDNGIGLPPDFEAKRKASLGLQIVSDLARQLNGGLVIHPGTGASFEMTFVRVDTQRI